MTNFEPSLLQNSSRPPMNLGTNGNEVRTEAQFQAAGGPVGMYGNQPVMAAPGFDAGDAIQMAEDMKEAGGATKAAEGLNRLPNARESAALARTQVRRGGDAGDTGDNGSSTAKGENAVETAQRIATFLELLGQAGRTTTAEAGPEVTLGRIRSSSQARSEELLGGLSASLQSILNGQLSDPEQIRQEIYTALAGFSSDPVQQLLALEVLRANADLRSGIFGEALDRVQQEFTSDVDGALDGAQMQMAVRDAYIALSLHEAAQRMRSSDPGDRRASMSDQLRSVDQGAKASSLGDLLDWLKETDPRIELNKGGLRDIFASQLQSTGRELSTNESPAMDRDHLGSVLTEIAALKLLNSVYDLSEELIWKSGLAEDAGSVMPFVLGFVSNAAPDRQDALRELSHFGNAIAFAASERATQQAATGG